MYNKIKGMYWIRIYANYKIIFLNYKTIKYNIPLIKPFPNGQTMC